MKYYLFIDESGDHGLTELVEPKIYIKGGKQYGLKIYP